MRKELFLFAATAMMLSSCSNDEVITSPQQAAIGFDNYVSKTSRATDASTNSLLSMRVFGYIGDATPVKIFDNTPVSRPNISSEWSYSPLQYWIAGKTYFFTAIASPVTEGNHEYSYTWADALPTDAATFNGAGTISFNNAEAAGNEDVVYASATKTTPATITSDPGKVGFSFKHALSRLKFTFVNQMGSDAYSVKVYNLTINNATSTADLVLGSETPTWSNHANTTTLTMRPDYFIPTNQTAANSAKVASGTKFIIPGTSTLKISFTVDLIVNGSVLATYNHVDQELPETTFQNGYSYNFVAALTPNNIDPENEMFPILFDVISVDGWEENGDTDVTLPETPGA